MPRPKFREVTIDEVKISREGKSVVFTYADDQLTGRRLRVGSELGEMTDVEILELHNDVTRTIQERKQSYDHVAVEIPVGQSQIEYSEQIKQWNMSGDVLRCYLEDTTNKETGAREPIVEIDDKTLSWQEFGKMLSTFAGWGMRLVIVPDDELHEIPDIQVKVNKETKLGN